MPQDVRPSPLAGRWYPDDKGKLKADLMRYLDMPTPTPIEQIHGLLSPHAGLIFWGDVGAKGYRHLVGQHFEIVVVIGPSHYPTEHAILTTGHDAFETTLGVVPVAKDILKKLGQKIIPVWNDPEHAIEMTLPFLQYLLGDFQLVPLVMRNQGYESSQWLATALHEVVRDKKVLYVASSDLSHFYPQKIANQMDKHTLDTISTYQANSVTALQDGGVVHACGYGAVATVMLVTQMQGGQVATQAGYGTSGDVTGDFSRVVGYGSVVFHN